MYGSIKRYNYRNPADKFNLKGRLASHKQILKKVSEHQQVHDAIDQYKKSFGIPYHGDENRLRETINDFYSYQVYGKTPRKIFHTEQLPNGTFRTALDKTREYWIYWQINNNDELEATNIKKH